MSPDNWARNPIVVRIMESAASLSKAFPSLAELLLAEPTDFAGITIFLGDTNEFVCGLRRFDHEGTPQILWSSGTSPLECLINTDKAVRSGKWRLDTKAIQSEIKPAKALK